MRTVNKLERRFKRAFANLEADVQTDADAEENVNLSKQVAVLEAELSEKDTKIDTLGADVTALTRQGVEATAKIADLETAAKTASKEVENLQVTVKQAKMSEAAVAKQVLTLEENLKAAKAVGQEAVDVSEKITAFETEVAALKAKLEETEAQSENYFDRMRKLRGTLRVMRVGLKKNILNAEDVNMVMQAELEALQTQRELDLKEVNVVLEKLTPLVEGK